MTCLHYQLLWGPYPFWEGAMATEQEGSGALVEQSLESKNANEHQEICEEIAPNKLYHFLLFI